MIRTISAVALTCVIGSLTLAAEAGGTKVELKDSKGNAVGTATLSAAKSGGVSIALDLRGLPAGEHAIHVHAVARCEAPFESAGPHFNPTAKKHGLQNPEGPHAGDMNNFTVAANGKAKTTLTNANVTLAAGAHSLYTNGGTALMIHAAADDMTTDPGGAAGDRIACGMITQ